MTANTLSDIVAAPFQWASALRGRRVFHPAGVLAGGRIERLAPHGQGLPITSCEVVARVSKGAGTPDALPDVVGLAWKMPPDAFPPTGWDVLLASTGPALSTRIGLRPVTSWSGVSLSSNGGILFAIEQACGAGPFELLAQLTLRRPLPADERHDVVFDPTIHSPQEVKLAPGWLTDLRRRAYDRSRDGRDGE